MTAQQDVNAPQDHSFMLAQLLEVTRKEAHYLQRTTARLQTQNIDLDWVKSLDNNDERSEMLDAFVARYSRLQDTLGDKLLRVLLAANLEKIGSQLDNLQRAEKLGWVESVQAWVQVRELRNRLIHEYMSSEDDLLAALQQALGGVALLNKTHAKMTENAKLRTTSTASRHLTPQSQHE